ncbi:MAG: class I SAM-dependent methyltransferase [Candidatus Competibacter sp.]|nr:class I SAM-dependent methyltransferase [Candidatus Competibacter sp.]
MAPDLANGGGGYHAEFYPELTELEAGNFWFQSRNTLIVWVMRRYFPKPRRVLEIGCGTGFVLSALASAFPKSELTGSEIFSAGLSHTAKRLPQAELLQMDARTIPYLEHFDVVGAFDVLEHIAEDEHVLHEIYQALRPGGGLILTVPQHPWLWSYQDEYACHVRRYTVSELKSKIAKAGFTTVYDTSFVSLLLPMMWLSRKRYSVRSENDPLSELRIGRLANFTLGMFMAFERKLIQLGVRFPAGGSLLLVARKG